MSVLPASPLFHTLPAGPLDIVGDVHGEWSALQALLYHLGYDAYGRHAHGRKLVFVGDLCDRGPDSPAVLAWLAEAMAAERAWAVLGNHELNLLMDDPKDGSGWYFYPRAQDEARYAPWQHLAVTERERVRQQLQQWPLLLYRDDIRIVHAAWLPEALARIAEAGSLSLRVQYQQYEANFRRNFAAGPWGAAYRQEQAQYATMLEDEKATLPELPATAQYDWQRSAANPIRSLLCGSEVLAPQPFYASGRWRFTARNPWWRHYRDDCPVLMGHYWRQWQPQPVAAGRLPLFAESPRAWLGERQNVFCLDYSVGARWRERHCWPPAAASRCHLAAMRWPEQVLVLDNGTVTTSVRHG